MEVVNDLECNHNFNSKELQRFNFKKGDTEGVVNYALSIEGVNVAAFYGRT